MVSRAPFWAAREEILVRLNQIIFMLLCYTMLIFLIINLLSITEHLYNSRDSNVVHPRKGFEEWNSHCVFVWDLGKFSLAQRPLLGFNVLRICE